MIRNWKLLTLYALFAAGPVAAQPAVLAQGADSNNDLKLILKRLETVEQMRTNIDALTGRVKTLEEKKLPPDRTADVLSELKKLEMMILGQVNDLRTSLQSVSGDAQGIKKNIEAVQADVQATKKEMASAAAEAQTARQDVQALKKDHAQLRGELGNLVQAQTKSDLTAQAAKSQADQLESQMTTLTREVRQLQKRLLAAGPAAAPVTPALDRRTLEDIRDKLGTIEQAVLKLQVPANGGMPYATNRIAMSPPVANTAQGRVLLVNHYTEDMLFILNNKTHRVPPGRTEVVEGIPAGPLSYQAVSPTWGVTRSDNTTLSPNETFTLTAR